MQIFTSTRASIIKYTFLLFVVGAGLIKSIDAEAQACGGLTGGIGGGVSRQSNGDICANSATTGGVLVVAPNNVNDADNPANFGVHVIWDDGTTTDVDYPGGGTIVWGGPGSHSYTATLSHLFPASGANVKCSYFPQSFLKSGGAVCPSQFGIAPEFVRWNTDDQNSGILTFSETITSLTNYLVCQGTSPTVTFTDRSTLNCVPPGFTDIPNQSIDRYRQFIYGTSGTTITGVLVNGTPVGSNYAGTAVSDYPANTTLPNPVNSLSITIPSTATVGQVYVITMNYWNACNTYPAHTPVTQTARITIISQPPPLTAPAATVACYGVSNSTLSFNATGKNAAATNVNWWITNPTTSTPVQISNPNGPQATSFPASAYTSPALGGTASGINTSLSGGAGGVYSLWVTQVLGGTNACESPPVEVVIQVKPKLTAPAAPSGTATLCNGTSGVIYTEPVAAPAQSIAVNNYTNSAVVNFTTQYLWSASPSSGVTFTPSSPAVGTSISTAFNLSPEPIPPAANINIASTIQYVDGTCSVAGSPLTVHVDGKSSISNISAGSIVCSGSAATTITVSGILGTITGWEVDPGTGTFGVDGSLGTGTSISPTKIVSSTTIFRYRADVTNGSCPANVSPIASVTVNPTPPQPVITPSGATTFCANSSVILSSSTTLANSYQWFLNGSLIGGATSQTYTVNSVAQSGAYTVQTFGVSPSNCPSSVSNPVSVTVQPLPSAANPTGGGAVCSGNPAPDIVWSLTGTAPFTVTYTANGTPTTTTTATNTFTISAPSPTVNTTYQITSLQDANSCPATTLGGTAQVTIGGTAPTFVTSPSLTPNEACFSASTPVQPSMTFQLDASSASGTGFKLVYKIDGGSPATKTFNTDASSKPNPALVFTETSLNTTTPSPHVLTVVSIQSPATCQTTFNLNLNYTVDPLPATPTGATGSNYCSTGSPNPITVATPASGFAIDWYSASTGGTLLASNTPSYTPTTAGTYYALTRNTTTGCVSSSRAGVTSTKILNPSAPNAGPNQSLCVNTATLAATPADNGGSGLWTVQSGTATITTPSSPTSTVTGLASGAVAVLQWTVNSSVPGVCAAQSATVTITTNNLPTANNINPQLCDDVAGAPLQTANIDLSTYNSLVTDATATVKWYTSSTRTVAFLVPPAPPGVTITNGQIFYYVATSTANCTSQGQALFTVNGLPSAVDKSAQFCDNLGGAGAGGINLTSYEMGASGITNGGTTATRTVVWYEDNGSGGLGAAIVNTTNYTITATKVVHGKVIDKTSPATPQCYDIADMTLIYKMKPADNPISGPGVVCTSPSGQIYQVDPTVNAYSNTGIPTTVHTYTWTVSGVANTIIAGGGTNTTNSFIFLKFPTAAGTAHFTVTETVDGCAGNVQTFDAIVAGAPPALAFDTPATQVCKGSTLTYSLTPASQDPTSIYNWTVTGGAIVGAASGPGLFTITVTWGSLTSPQPSVSVTQTSAQGCAGAPASINVYLNDVPTMTSPTTNDVCSNSTPSLVFASSLPGTYSWKVTNITGAISGTSVGNTGTGNLGATFTGAAALRNTSGAVGSVSFDVTPTASAAPNCVGTTQSVVLNVNPEPALVSPQTKTICSGVAVNYEILLTPLNLPTGTTFSWPKPVMSDASAQGTADSTVASGAPGTLHITDILTNTSGTTITATYSITPTSGLGCVGATRTVVITVNPQPVLKSTLSSSQCSQVNIGLTLSIAPGSIAANNYNIVSRSIPAGLTAAGGNATVPATGVSPSYLSNDQFVNQSSGALIVSYVVSPVSSAGCIGTPVTIQYTINPEPILASGLDASVCSDQVIGIVLSTKSGSVAAAGYNVTSISVATGLTGAPTNVPIANGVGANYIAADSYTNKTAGSLTVVYKVSPVSASGCQATPAVPITVTVAPEPVMANLSNTVCSHIATGLTLNTNGTSVAAGSYNITVRTIDAGLVAAAANAVVPATGATASYLANDIFTNTTSSTLNVKYTVTPISSGGCSGDPVIIQMTINPEPVMSTALNAAACSHLPIGLKLNTNGTSVAAASYNITARSISPGLVANAGNAAAPANGVVANYFANDIFSNTTSGVLTVTYTVTPVASNGCLGVSIPVVISINPEPIMSTTLDGTVCSELPIGLVLNTNGSSVGAATYNVNSITPATGLNPSGSNVPTKNGVAANYLQNDVYFNTTGSTAKKVVYNVTPVSSLGCLGTPINITITVNPEPVLSTALNSTVCSGAVTGLTLNTNGISTGASNYNVKSITVPTGLTPAGTNAVVANNVAANYLANDKFTNVTNAAISVTYTIVANSASGCPGPTGTVIIQINPEPVMSASLNTAVCSDLPIGLNFATNGTSVGATTYNVTARTIGGSLIPAVTNATVPSSGVASSYLNADSYTNTTSNDINVTYTVAPVSANNCVGQPVIITVIIHPEPVISTTLATTVCSQTIIGVTLATNGTSVAASTYNLVSVTVPAGLTAAAGNAVVGSGSNTLIKNDKFTNQTSGPLNVSYTVTGTSAAGCVSNSATFLVTINPEPVIPTLDATACSGVAIGLVLNTNGTSVAASSYNIVSKTATGLTPGAGNVVLANGVTANYLANDKYTNLTSAPLTAVYVVQGVAATGCLSQPKTITITINPEPILSTTLNTTVCSHLSTGITLAVKTPGSVAAQNYNVTTIVIDPALVAGASNAAIPGTGVNAGYISNDKFTNTTAAALKVTYTVVPVSAAGCKGAAVSVVLTVNPEPVIPNTLSNTICSGVASGLTFITNGTSVAAASYNVLSVVIAPGLTGTSKPAANGVAATYFATDVFSNITTTALTVTYVVAPVSASACIGSSQTIVITIDPQPVVSAGLDATVCSDAPIGLNLTSTSTSAASTGWKISTRVIAPSLTPAGTNAVVPSAASVPANYLAADQFTNITTAAATVVYTVIPYSSANCPGVSKTVTLTIDPKPVIASGLDATVCSDNVVGLLLKTTTTSVAASGYNIISRVPGAGLVAHAGNATVPASNVGTGYLTNDSFTNQTAGNLTVVYTVVPVSSVNCPGTAATITITVNPEPVLSPSLNATVCSGAVTGLNLSVTATSVAAASYNITSIVSTGLAPNAGNAVVANNKTAAYLASDKFTNTTNGPLPVKYTIVPVSGASCPGDPVVATITINPEPVVSNALNKTICSTSPTGLVLATSATSVAAASYNVTAISFPGTITPASGNATPATAVAAGYLSNDSWTNTTGASVNVTYTVVGVSSAGCSGASQAIVIAVTPQPVLSSSLNKTACSGVAGGISLAVASGSAAASSYNIISATVPAGVTLVSAPTIPASGVGASYLATATYSNVTNASLDVLFTVQPVGATGSCVGNPIVVKQTINPEPVLGVLDKSVCSEAPVTLTLATNGTSVNAATYNFVSLTATGLTANAGNAVIPATGKSSTYLLNDKFTNTTSAPLFAKYTIVPVSSSTCAGASAVVTVTINPEPVLSTALGTTVCSESPSGITLAVVASSVAAANYNVASISGTGGLIPSAGNAVVANGVSATAIKNDSYTNTTASPITVTYSIVPVSASGCLGLPVNVALVISPEPVMNPALASETICSRVATGITLSTNGVSVGAATYNVTLVSQDAGLTGTPTTGSGLSATAIKADNFVNVTSNPLQVKYQIVPKSAALCLGQPFLITVTVNAEPVLASSLDNTVCSESPSNIVLGGDGISVLANSYKLVSVTFPGTISANASNITVGSSGGINLIKNDSYTNTTASAVAVTYMIIGTSQSGCPGQPKTITLTVSPEPTLVPPTSVVCSDVPSGIILGPKAGTPAITSYTLKNILLGTGLTPSGSPNAGLGTYTANDFLKNDQFTNTTAGPLQVTYTLNAISNGCPGIDQTVVLTVNPAPAVASNLSKSVCTNDATGILLATDPSSAPASTYNIVTVVISAGLTQTAGNAGNNRTGKAATEIQGDKFNNPASNPLTVTYNVQAVTATGCVGPVKAIVLTVEPTITSTPVNTKPDICSNDVTHILLTTTARPSAGRVSFNYTAASSVGGLLTGFIPAVSNLPDSSVIADNLVNNSNHSATVTYTITGLANGAKQGAGCVGSPVTVVVTVEPSPKMTASPLISTICEGAPSAIVLTTPTVVSTGTIQFKVDSTKITGGLTLTSPATPKTLYVNNESITDVWNNPDTIQHTVIYYFHALVSGGLGCNGAVVAVTLNVNPSPVVKATVQAPICSNDFVNISLTSNVAGTVNSWTTTVTGSVSGAGSGSGDLIFQTLKNTGTSPATVHYNIIPKASGCAGAPLVVDVTVNPIPTITGVPSSATVCYNGTLTQPLASPVSGVTFKWTVDPFPNAEGVPASDSGNVISKMMVNNSGSEDFLTYTIIATGPAPTFCQSTPKIFSVIAAPKINVSFLNPDTTYLCLQNNKDFLQVQLDGQAPFTFTYSVNDTLQPALTKVGGFKSISITPKVQTVYKIVSVSDAFGCTFAGPFPSVTYEVGSTDASFAVVGSSSGCSPYTATLKYNLKKGTEYTWRWGDGSPDSVFTYNGANLAGATIQHTYTNTSPTATLQPKIVLQTDLPVNYPGCVKSTTIGVTVYPQILTNVYPDKSQICSGDEVIFTNQSIGVPSTGNRWFYRVQGNHSRDGRHDNPVCSICADQ